MADRPPTSADPQEATRVTRVFSPRPGVEVRAIRRATLIVAAGPDRGKVLELGDRSSGLIGTHPDADLSLSDDTVSRRHAEIRAEPNGYRLRDLDSTNGIRVMGVRVPEALLDGGTTPILLGQTQLELVLSRDTVEHALSRADRFGAVLGRSPEMRQVFATLERVAPTETTVLLEGESGAGKEVLAEAIHRASSRAGEPFIVFDCAAAAAGVIESELFGHELGAFSGADRARPGLIEEAAGGTLFIDEIGELPLELQPKLLRALSERQVKRVGAAGHRAADVRIIAATKRDLRQRVAAKAFRSDLYYRLAVVRVVVPPLRHRPEDVSLLAQHFVAQLRPDLEPAQLLSAPILAAMSAYQWPGNVRELRNAMERLATVGELGSAVRSATEDRPPDYHAARGVALERFERAYVAETLAACDNVVQRAAERAGISRQMFHRLMRRHGLGR